MTVPTIQTIWPALGACSDAQRYAHALDVRLKELGFNTGATNSDALVCIALQPPGYPAPENHTTGGLRIDATPGLAIGTADDSMLPFVFDDQGFLCAMPALLESREERQGYAFIVFASGRQGEAQLFAEVKQHLVRLTEGEVRFTVIGNHAECAAQDDAIYRKTEIVWLAPQGDAYARALQNADAALYDPSAGAQGLYAALLCEVPLVAKLSSDADYPGAGIGACDATPEELAGLLLLLATDPPIRRRTLDAQHTLRQAHSPDAQRSALARWLVAAGVTVPLHTAPQPEPRARCQVEGVFDSSYSLAIVNRHLAMALEDLGERVALYTYEQGDDPNPQWETLEQPQRIRQMWERSREPQPPALALRNAWPPVVRDMRGTRRVLANYAWEETAFPEALAEGFNQTLDLITVVSSQTAKVLRDAGVRTPMAVVGNGVDHLLNIAPAPLPRPLPGGYRFLHVSSCFPRKGVDVLLRAYGAAFRSSDDVTLVIKTFPNPHNDVARQLAEWREKDTGYPRVELIEEDWSPEQIVGLYHVCHALVAPSRGEGFGLPLAEAMLHRLPVITTAWGGQLDFCNDETVWLIDYTPQLAQTHIDLPNSLWAEPDAESLKHRLREVFALSQEERERKTARARERIIAHYTWRQAAQRTLAALEAVNAQPAPLPQPRIGWISTWGSRCGIAAYSAHLTEAFAADRLHIYAPCNEAIETVDAPNVWRNWVLGTGQLDQVCEHALAHKLDALVVQFNWAFLSLGALSDLAMRLTDKGVKVYIFFHNTSSSIAAKLADVRPALSRCERLLVHSVSDVQRLKNFGYEDNVTLFPLGVYPVALPDETALAAMRQKLGLARKKVLATYGFLMPHKGLSVLIEAMPRLLQAHPDLHLLMVNAFYSEESSGPELKHLQQRIAELGLRNRVTLITDFLPEEESLGLLALADLIAFPYQNSEESSSAAVRMALLAGRPVAVTPLPIFSDIATAVAKLPGTSADALASGIGTLLRELEQREKAQAYIDKAHLYVDRHNSRRLSRRLHSLIEGCAVQARLPIEDGAPLSGYSENPILRREGCG